MSQHEYILHVWPMDDETADDVSHRIRAALRHMGNDFRIMPPSGTTAPRRGRPAAEAAPPERRVRWKPQPVRLWHVSRPSIDPDVGGRFSCVVVARDPKEARITVARTVAGEEWPEDASASILRLRRQLPAYLRVWLSAATTVREVTAADDIKPHVVGGGIRHEPREH